MAIDSSFVRSQFPPLSLTEKGKPLIYFDNACMTLKPKSVIEAITGYYNNHPSCHNRSIHYFGKKTSLAFAEARNITARHINAYKTQEVIFTRNTTESINLVAQSLGLASGQVVITSDFEHNSNLLPWQFLAHRKDVVHKTYSLGLEASGEELSELEELLKEGNVKLVSTFLTSHVTGITQPITEISKLAHKYGALVLVDAAQGLPHQKIDVKAWQADFIAFSYHKAFGPSGMGALWGREDLLKKLDPFLTGGETVLDVDYQNCTLAALPERLEAGLQNYSGAIGGAAALKFISSIDYGQIAEHELMLNKFVSEELSKLEKVKLIGPSDASKKGSIVNFYIEGLDSGELSLLLDKTSNIMLRSGVHCCHAWYHKQELQPTLRASFSIYNTMEEVELFLKTLKDFLKYY
ncbi:MAG: aminotransferase class V-fold PLP-dependent enzyme [Halobacteriovoraceae bacterium]|jgi:cysteine desulfurase / selenocysteine lyase|nr:aminotransferase class V-fold PLP-dependent enzyme [Halobacteriovoraceae bacterium]MBT5094073.1 aminotransferase class V-fold PLP-dependent enzyme [Halobacteriovoraceae bacterium]